jgi:hypothetical protein
VIPVVRVRNAAQTVAIIAQGRQGAEGVGIELPSAHSAVETRRQRGTGESGSLVARQEISQRTQHRHTRRVLIVECLPSLPQGACLLSVPGKDGRAVNLVTVVQQKAAQITRTLLVNGQGIAVKVYQVT